MNSRRATRVCLTPARRGPDVRRDDGEWFSAVRRARTNEGPRIRVEAGPLASCACLTARHGLRGFAVRSPLPDDDDPLLPPLELLLPASLRVLPDDEPLFVLPVLVGVDRPSV